MKVKLEVDMVVIRLPDVKRVMTGMTCRYKESLSHDFDLVFKPQ